MSKAIQATKQAKSQIPPRVIEADSTASRAKAMRDAQKPTAYELVVTLTLNALYNGIKELNSGIEDVPTDSGMQEDSNATWAMDLVTKEIVRMLGRTPVQIEFTVWLYGLGGVIQCAQRSLTNKDTYYFRKLDWFINAIGIYGEMVEDASRQGPTFLQREVAA